MRPKTLQQSIDSVSYERGNLDPFAYESESTESIEKTDPFVLLLNQEQPHGDLLDQFGEWRDQEAEAKEAEQRRKTLEEAQNVPLEDWDQCVQAVRDLKDKFDASKMDFTKFINNMNDIARIVQPYEFENFTQGVLPILEQMTDSHGEKLFKSPGQVIGFVRALRFNQDAGKHVAPAFKRAIRKEKNPKIVSAHLRRSMRPQVKHTWDYEY